MKRFFLLLTIALASTSISCSDDDGLEAYGRITVKVNGEQKNFRYLHVQDILSGDVVVGQKIFVSNKDVTEFIAFQIETGQTGNDAISSLQYMANEQIYIGFDTENEIEVNSNHRLMGNFSGPFGIHGELELTQGTIDIKY